MPTPEPTPDGRYHSGDPELDELLSAIVEEQTDESIFSFVNNVATPDGGTHVTGFRSAVTKTLTDYLQNSKEKISFLPS